MPINKTKKPIYETIASIYFSPQSFIHIIEALVMGHWELELRIKRRGVWQRMEFGNGWS
jgi:hypothetical protein